MTIAEWVFSPSGLTPHGFCLTWAPGLLWLHAGSDAITAAAYFSIPLALARFVSLRRDLQYRWIAYLFGAFILACGVTHVMSVYTLWVPAYGVEGLIKLVTALLSIATAAILWPLTPRLVALPSPEELRALNSRLSETVVEQARTAALLRDSEARALAINRDLESRVAARTAELSAANARLTEALAERTAAETAMRESEHRLRVAVEGARLGVWEMDFENSRGRLDARSAALTGGSHMPVDTWISLEGPEIAAWVGQIHPEDIEVRNAAVREIREGGKDLVEFDYRVRADNSEWRTLTQWRAVTARAPDTNLPTRAVGVILDVTERAKAEAEIRAALSQRDLLLREVYHRVKNNLQIVDGLLLLQSRDLTDPQAAETLLTLRSRIYALGLVHAQLMASKNLETFDIAPFLHELTHNIVAGAGNPEVGLEMDSCSLEADLDFAVPLGLLVTELVTNSLKHAFSDRPGRITVKLSREDGRHVTLTVADDGEASGGSRGKPGIGQSIVAGLVRQLSGSMTVDGTNGRVTTIVIPEPEIA